MKISHWQHIGPQWKTGDIFRVREILKNEHIPFKMPFSDIFFTTGFHQPAADKRWSILIREKDRVKVTDLLAREGLVRRNPLRKADTAGNLAGQDPQGSPFLFRLFPSLLHAAPCPEPPFHVMIGKPADHAFLPPRRRNKYRRKNSDGFLDDTPESG